MLLPVNSKKKFQHLQYARQKVFWTDPTRGSQIEGPLQKIIRCRKDMYTSVQQNLNILFLKTTAA